MTPPVTSNASYPLIAAAVVLGVGSGATLMPAMTLATRDLDDARTPQGTTLLALVQQLAAALGTAVVAAAVTITVTDAVPALRGGGLHAMLSLDRATRAGLETSLSHAVGVTYAVVAALVLLAVITAALTVGNPRAHQNTS